MTPRFRRWITATAVITASLMLLAGEWRNPWLWAYAGAASLVALGCLFSIDEDLARERFHPPESGADRLPLRFVRLAALAHLVVGALDSGRWHLAPVPSTLRAFGIAGMIAAAGLIMRAMRANRFFSAVVRVQSDRGHYVVSTGPYAHIRHPGYLGMLLAIPCSGLALGSWLSVAFAAAYMALIIRRVIFEDAFLQTNLPGYREYASRVPHRLVPGAW